ncbi:MFS transporter, BCD family, chlorophyll transporter [Jannaschia faecimaris]|uniref:MFS transporter, BCD family, chlorophyll transporter n=1 Tax=Jannaschia faecimaris TaxID=1244108 RepID=A0A1H3TCM2_9RHOB|nr:PucC family protein [Jannaschia faecimaris]SDZ47974.1 MFS transporter, BCD family, chlorophyll transporter [Jannaschia faecimaris]
MIFGRRMIQGMTLNMLPFSDAVSEQLPLRQLLRLSLFQVSVGMASVMLLGTLNRVMIVELGVAATIVAMMIAIPVLVAPFRAILGFRSDTYRSAIGWKRIPYLWFGSLWQFGGLAIMPMALLVLSGDQVAGPDWAGTVGAALAFLMTGLGMHMTQTAGLALAADRATEETRPQVVALLYVMFLVGMGVSAVIIGTLLRDFSALRLVQVVQGTAVVTIVLNTIALWKQEKVTPMTREERAVPRPPFRDAWRDLTAQGNVARLLVVVFIGTLAFNMQDVLLEPYGGEILGLSVSATTLLTSLWAGGALLGFGVAARGLKRGRDPFRMAGGGILAGVCAFSAVIFAAPLDSGLLFYIGAFGIGFGGGLFSVCTLTAIMAFDGSGTAGKGLALGAWGAAQATAAGVSIFVGGALRDGVNALAETGRLGAALSDPATGYSTVYHIEIALLFITLAALGPLVRSRSIHHRQTTSRGLADFPT